MPVVAPVLERLLVGAGTAAAPLHDVTFRGLTFAHATWLAPNRPSGFPQMIGSWIYPRHASRMPGHVAFRAAERVSIEGNRFTHLGGLALVAVQGGRGQHGARQRRRGRLRRRRGAARTRRRQPRRGQLGAPHRHRLPQLHRHRRRGLPERDGGAQPGQRRAVHGDLGRVPGRLAGGGQPGVRRRAGGPRRRRHLPPVRPGHVLRRRRRGPRQRRSRRRRRPASTPTSAPTG